MRDRIEGEALAEANDHGALNWSELSTPVSQLSPLAVVLPYRYGAVQPQLRCAQPHLACLTLIPSHSIVSRHDASDLFKRLNSSTGSLPRLRLPPPCRRHVAMARETPNMSAVKRWSFRIIPFFIFGTFGVASYAVAGHICGASKIIIDGDMEIASTLTTPQCNIYTGTKENRVLPLASWCSIFYS